MSCISQSLYSLIHVMIEVSYVIVNVIIFKACEKIFTSFSHRWNVYDLREKERPLGVHDKQPHVPVQNVISCDLRVLLDDSLVSSNIKHDSVIHGVLVSVFSSVKKCFCQEENASP